MGTRFARESAIEQVSDRCELVAQLFGRRLAARTQLRARAFEIDYRLIGLLFCVAQKGEPCVNTNAIRCTLY